MLSFTVSFDIPEEVELILYPYELKLRNLFKSNIWITDSDIVPTHNLYAIIRYNDVKFRSILFRYNVSNQEIPFQIETYNINVKNRTNIILNDVAIIQGNKLQLMQVDHLIPIEGRLTFKVLLNWDIDVDVFGQFTFIDEHRSLSTQMITRPKLLIPNVEQTINIDSDISIYQVSRQYMAKLNQSVESITDKDVWDSVLWFVNNSHLLPTENINKVQSIEQFKPNMCHRKLYKVFIDDSPYIFSPMHEAMNKWTPIYEYYNYILATLLEIPEGVYIPVVTKENIIGIGSLKVFVNIRTKIKMSNLAKPLRDWIMIYDYIICNIEREWSDHLCEDRNGTVILIDNDLGIQRAAEFEKLDCCDIENKGIIIARLLVILATFTKHFNDAPYHWSNFIQQRIDKLISFLQK